MKSRELDDDLPVYLYSNTTYETLNEELSPYLKFKDLNEFSTLKNSEIIDVPGA